MEYFTYLKDSIFIERRNKIPYIKKEGRQFYDEDIDRITNTLLEHKNEDNALGDLNYVIYSIVLKYLHTKGLNYSRIAKLVGTIECCKQEIYRRIATPYENRCIEKNGNILVERSK